MNTRPLAAAALLLCAALLPMGCKKPPPPPKPTPEPTATPVSAKERIAFVRHGQLWSCAADGAQPVLVFSNPKYTVWFPSASRQGAHYLCFVGRADGSQDVARIEADGSRLELLTDFSSKARPEMRSLRLGNAPVYSPDGSRIAFSHNGDIWLMDPDGADLTTLIGDHHSWSPAWSPDGKRIVYVNGTGSRMNLWVADVTSRDTYQVTDFPEHTVGRPRWGFHDTLYFVKSQKDSDQIASVPANTSEPLVDSTPITRGMRSMGLELTPDLLKLVFVAAPDEDPDAWDLWQSYADGSRPIRLSREGAFSPAWLKPTSDAPAKPAVASGPTPAAPAKPAAQPAHAAQAQAQALPTTAASKPLPAAQTASAQPAAAQTAAPAIAAQPGAKKPGLPSPERPAAAKAQPTAAPQAPVPPVPVAVATTVIVSKPVAGPSPVPAKAAPLKINVSVAFAKGTDQIEPASLPALDKLVARIKQYAGGQIRIQGPLDASPTEGRFASALDRSRARAAAVRDRLAKASNLPASTIEVLPYTPPVLGAPEAGSGLKVLIQLK